MNPIVRRIVYVMGSQVSKTETGINICGHKLDTDPAPLLFVGPTKSNIDRVIEPRIAQMLQQCASLWSKTVKGRKANKLAKVVAGVVLRLAWAGSPTELASQPAHTVILDEVDRMKPIPGEGSAPALAEARIATYPDGRIVMGSSPTEGTVKTYVHPVTGIEHWAVADGDDVPSSIWKFWQEGTRFEWAVPCPHCAQYFIQRFRLLWWPEKCSPKRALAEARLICPRCGARIDETAKHGMNEAGTFLSPGQSVEGYDPKQPGRPTHPALGFGDGNGNVVGETEDTECYSFWVSGLCSPWRTFGQRAAKWIRASSSGDQEQIRVVINTDFGELYTVRGEAPKWEDVRDGCAADYREGDVPRGVQLVFLSVDVQKDRFVYVVRGFGHAFESWRIESGELWGETDQPDAWSRLDELRDRLISEHGLKATAIDSGYRSDNVYAWAGKHGTSVYATKGKDGASKIYAASEIEVKRNGRKVRGGVKLWTLDDKYFKGWVHDRLNWPADQPGAWRLPKFGADGGEVPHIQDYCKQLVAESRLRLPSGRVTWVGGHRPHDYLDCEAGLAFLATIEGVRLLKKITDAPVAGERKTLADIARRLNE